MSHSAVVESFIFAEILLREVSYTILIPTALTIVKAHDGGAASSGLLIGLPKLASIVGVPFGHFMKQHQRLALLMEPLCRLVAMPAWILAAQTAHDPWKLLVASRFVEGLGSGITNPAGRSMLAKSSRSDDAFVMRAFYQNLGQGLGPLLNTLCTWQWEYVFGTHHSWCAGPLMVFILTIAYVLLFLYLCMDVDVGRNNALQGSGGLITTQPPLIGANLAICIGLMLAAFRQTCSSSIETAAAYIYEVEFGWSLNTIGVVISCTFLACIPGNAFFRSFKMTHDGRLSFILIANVICIVGFFAFHPDVTWFADKVERNGGIVLMICAEIIMFPLLYISGGVLDGMSTEIAKRHPETISIETVSALQCVFLAVGRTAAPPLARGILESPLGRKGYSISLAILCVFAGLAYNAFVRPVAQTLRQEPKSSYGASSTSDSSVPAMSQDQQRAVV